MDLIVHRCDRCRQIVADVEPVVHGINRLDFCPPCVEAFRAFSLGEATSAAPEPSQAFDDPATLEQLRNLYLAPRRSR